MEANDILVSIIIPVYRTEEHLDHCVQSLLAQDHHNLEIILVDDGSPDRCPSMCDTYARKYNHVYVIHKENAGAAYARETGLRAATGEFVLFLDSDDWLDSDTVSSCLEVALQHDSDCVLFGYIREYPGKSIENPLFEQSFSYDIVQSEESIHRRIVGFTGREMRCPHRIDNLSSFGMRLLRTDVARRGRFVSERLVGTSEDTIFNLYALENCRISYISRCFYHYRKNNAQSITTAYKPDLSEKWDVMYDIFLEYIQHSGKMDAYYQPFLNRVACGMIGLGLNEVRSPASIQQKANSIKHILRKPLYQEAFAHLDTSECGVKWKLFFWLCKSNATYLLTILLYLIDFLRSRTAG